jgi:membrane associated rhomboid family serine protease
MTTTMTHSGPKSLRKNKIDISQADPKPVLTVCWMILPVLISAVGGPALIANDRIDWVTTAGFTAAQLGTHLATEPSAAFSYMIMASLAMLSPAMWAINSLFLWLLGAPIERKLKGWRYPAFLVMTVVSGWLCIYYTAGFNRDKIYIGPSMMLFGLLGAYFAYFPKKPFKPEQWVKPSTEIFKKEDKTPIHERYWVSPWTYVIAFAIFQIALQIGLTTSRDQIVNMTGMPFLGQVYTFLFGRMQVSPSAFSPIAAMFQIGIGALLAQILPMLAMSLKPKRPGGNLQLEVIQHYRELRTLDMTHDQACEGAAKFSAVPIDIAKDWIAKGAAGLKDQNIKH